LLEPRLEAKANEALPEAAGLQQKNMVRDRRRSERLVMRGGGKIQFGIGALPRDCRISDVSDGGARLHVEGFEVPQQFILWLSPNESRECKVAWRLGHEVGAQFIDAHQSGFGRRTAAPSVKQLAVSTSR
jgi:hypothetical protein